MSAQTGSAALDPPSPASTRFERATHSIRAARRDPNPVWMREMRQAARLTRTPVILAVLTGMIALLMCSIGGIASVSGEPATVGSALFHTFFSVAFAVVTWIGPAVAASTVAGERGGRTWEALLLTGLGPEVIARGKFLASLTYISLYVVMLVPVGALPFLFGGVTAMEVITAFVLLFLFAVLSVAFGLSISSTFSNSAVAIVITLILSIVLSMQAYGLLGPALSFAVHDLWPAVPEGFPVWLPTAYTRASFGLEYVTFLIVAPLVATVLPAWFFYEITVANMQSLSDDRSSGIRRWFLVATPVLAVTLAIPAFVVPSDAWVAGLFGVGAFFWFTCFAAFVFAGEPAGPSRRVLVRWNRTDVGAATRYLGPGILQATSLLLMLGLGGIALIAAASLVAESLTGVVTSVELLSVGVFAGYAAAFMIFLGGFTAWVRSRATSTAIPRLLIFAALFVAFVGPWIVAAIAGVITRSDDALVVGAPSPAYVGVMLDKIDSSSADLTNVSIIAGALSAAAWALLGVGLLAAARVRVGRVLREHARGLAAVEKMLADEDGPSGAVEEGAEPVGEAATEGTA